MRGRQEGRQAVTGRYSNGCLPAEESPIDRVYGGVCLSVHISMLCGRVVSRCARLSADVFAHPRARQLCCCSRSLLLALSAVRRWVASTSNALGRVESRGLGVYQKFQRAMTHKAGEGRGGEGSWSESSAGTEKEGEKGRNS